MKYTEQEAMAAMAAMYACPDKYTHESGFEELAEEQAYRTEAERKDMY